MVIVFSLTQIRRSILVGFIVTLVALPFIPDTAFIPALLLSIIIFVTLSLKGKQEDILSGQVKNNYMSNSGKSGI